MRRRNGLDKPTFQWHNKYVEEKKSLYPSGVVVLEELRQQRANLTRVIDAIDNKLVILLGMDGIIVSIVVALFALSELELRWVFVPPMLFLLTGFILAVFAFWPRKWAYHPSPKSLMEKYIKRKPETFDSEEVGTVAQIAASIRTTCEEIQKTLKTKTNLLRFSLAFEGAGVALIGLYFAIYVIIGG
ncbi:hypothetical protein CEE36_04980 [candidate division TA06 bacterium B3_TA06]|uniref:Pycsar effector protein domain-containing protein n=1 Tax=candidate division TA06 bacterium B3_TA06 TaxID=2012487 RepID=A0A532V7C8_UNCT6|nr:MAG: hypothetical protein CEE36_04980 [candidate division TA06 bacterium B3_TA06]